MAAATTAARGQTEALSALLFVRSGALHATFSSSAWRATPGDDCVRISAGGSANTPRILSRSTLHGMSLLLPSLVTGFSVDLAAQGPCDIFAAGGTPCVAAHSTVRAMYSAYSGKDAIQTESPLTVMFEFTVV